MGPQRFLNKRFGLRARASPLYANRSGRFLYNIARRALATVDKAALLFMKPPAPEASAPVKDAHTNESRGGTPTYLNEHDEDGRSARAAHGQSPRAAWHDIEAIGRSARAGQRRHDRHDLCGLRRHDGGQTKTDQVPERQGMIERRRRRLRTRLRAGESTRDDRWRSLQRTGDRRRRRQTPNEACTTKARP